MLLRSEPGRLDRRQRLVHRDRTLDAWNVLPRVRESAGFRLLCLEHELVERNSRRGELLRDDHRPLTSVHRATGVAVEATPGNSITSIVAEARRRLCGGTCVGSR